MANQSGEPRKVRWTVPAADTSVIEWLNEQADISQSIRLLIRESIQRDGYIDVFYKPVDQLPRRGRPPLEITEQREDDEATAERRPAARPVQPQPQPVVTDQADAVVKNTAPAPVAQPEPVPAPAETAEEPAASAPNAPPEPPKQASIDEIMASTRR
ncbi:hypothetical protein GCM10010306_099380 [Streptomyces umbrinus]|uniref:hypothetical protein n=1 Tax=Streptomyces umbrinus TaxID=67370 RepID=UPI0016796B8D|nr:hypothetical protein [Streptomyces umbrinus]GHB88467.1 hypothetical protein GCM10010306_099380 [Streptomyces umbrinus]